MKTKKNLLHSLLIALTTFYVYGCSKSEPVTQVLKAEGYVIGYHPCAGNVTVTTSKGKGKGYLIATTDAEPDTLMVYGVPVGMFDIPEEWFSHTTNGYLLPLEGRKKFKMRFSYQQANEKEKNDLQFACNTMYPTPNIKYLEPQYIIIKAEKVE